MLKNYLLIAIRDIFKRKLFSIINILGLSLSMSAGLLIILMLIDLLGYDQFHENEERIFRIITRSNNSSEMIATSPMALKNTLLEEYDGIEKVVRFKGMLGGDVKYEENTQPLAGYYTDEDFFNVFSFKLENGDPGTALSAPFSMVLSEKASKRLFGEEDPLGKVVSFNDRGMNTFGFDFDVKDLMLGDFKITGVIKDNDQKSHIKFDLLVSMSTLESLINSGVEKVNLNDWKNVWDTHVYFLAKEGVSVSELNSMLENVSEIKYQPYEDYTAEFQPQHLSEITPGKLLGNPMSLTMPLEGFYFLSILALIIIISACFNYTNLTIARSLSRMKEIALRKINGASRHQVFTQFILEAIVISFIALLLSILILHLIKPGFSGLWINKYMAIGLQDNVSAYILFVLLSLLVGTISGLIPAILLSSFRPLGMLGNKLTGSFNKKGIFIFRKPWLGKSLTVVQLILSLFFIITSTLLYLQLKHFVKAEYGFNRDNIININLRGNDYAQMAHEFSSWSGVKQVSASSLLPATLIREGDMIYKLDESKDSLHVDHISIDHNFIQNLNIEIIAGTDFRKEMQDENKRFIILNETAVRKLGYENVQDIIGEKFSTANVASSTGDAEEIGEVIGIVKDFHYDIFMDQVGPFMFHYFPDKYRYLNVRVAGENLNETLAFLERTWKKMDKIHAFQYQFFDEQLADSHGIMSDVLSIVGFVSIIAIVIASMGLLGMATYSAETKIKEIGIRKVLGASVSEILVHISKGYVFLLLIAIVVASPLAYFINNAWLQNFAIRVQFNIWILAFGMLMLLIIGLMAIGSQTIKASLTNPADTLRDE